MKPNFFFLMLFVAALAAGLIFYEPLHAFYLAHKKVVLLAHLFGVVLGVGAATFTDIFFFKFLKDNRISHKEADVMETFTSVIWFALALLVLSGAMLYAPEAVRLNDSSKFLTKMIAFAVLVTNGIALNFFVSPKLIHLSFAHPHDETAYRRTLRRTAFALGGISITSWYFIFIIAGLRQISIPFGTLLSIYIGLLICAIVGSQIFEYYMTIRARTVVK